MPKNQAVLWIVLALWILPATTYLRLTTLDRPLYGDPHSRQSQTALTTYYLAKGHGSIFKYESPFEGQLWNHVIEFPLYQWVASRGMRAGLSMEVASRGTALICFVLGTLFLSLWVYEVWGLGAAMWAGLVFLGMPLHILFSRAGMIDLMASALLMGCLWLTWRGTKPHRALWPHAVGIFVLGALAGLTKVNIWYVPAAGTFVFLAYLMGKGQLDRRRGLVFLGAYALQCGVAGAWIQWAGSMNNVSVQSDWLFGTVADRLVVDKWLAIARRLRTIVFGDWLILPFALGLWVTARRYRAWFYFFAACLVLPVLAQINPHAHDHDYYFLIETPFYAILIALGFQALFQLPSKYQAACLTVMLALLAFRTFKMPYYLEGMYAYQPKSEIPQLLKAHTQPSDIIFYDKVVHGGGIEIPLYAERYVRFSKPWSEVRQLEPSVWHFDDEKLQFHQLDRASTVWLTGTPALPLYRVKQATKLDVNPQKNLIVSTDPIISDYSPYRAGPMRMDTCQSEKPKGVKFAATARTRQRIKVASTRRVLLLPLKNYLTLPPQSEWGCRFEVSLAPVEMKNGR